MEERLWEFCGSELKRCPTTHEIIVSQENFAEKLEKPKLRNRESPLVEVTASEAFSLKSVLGGALWLARETRPDLAVQVSQGQQLLPKPTLGAARTVGNVVRRAKQYKNLVWKILPIPFEQIKLCLHTDAAFANAKKQGTQAGYLVGVTTNELQAGKPAPWSPCVWKSYRLKRVVGATFAGESQVLSDGLGHAEWIACHLSEAKFPDFLLANRSQRLGEFKGGVFFFGICFVSFLHVFCFSWLLASGFCGFWPFVAFGFCGFWLLCLLAFVAFVASVAFVACGFFAYPSICLYLSIYLSIYLSFFWQLFSFLFLYLLFLLFSLQRRNQTRKQASKQASKRTSCSPLDLVCCWGGRCAPPPTPPAP